MSTEDKQFAACGFLYNPLTQSVLLQHRDDKTPHNPNKWGFFGGGSEPGETPTQALQRELKEELNIDVPEDHMLAIRNYAVPEFDTHRYVFYVESVLEKSEMQLSEGQGFDWIPLDTVFTYDLADRAREDLQIFLQQLEQKRLRQLAIKRDHMRGP